MFKITLGYIVNLRLFKASLGYMRSCLPPQKKKVPSCDGDSFSGRALTVTPKLTTLGCFASWK